MIQEIKQRRMANEILRIVHECDAGMKQGIAYYRAEKNPAVKLELLKRAVRLPFRVEARIQAMVAKYGAAAINQSLALVSNQTLTTLQAVLAPLKTYSDGLKTAYQGGATAEQIAQDIGTNRPDPDLDENVPLPLDFADDM